MDGRRFDELARSMAGAGGDRRRLLKGFAAGAAAAFGLGRGGQARAQESGVYPGGACSSTTQCIQDAGDLAVICADNGIAEDGGLNCCRNEGGGCADGAGCCAAFLCVAGVCTSSAGAPVGTGLAVGSQCSFAGQCDQSGGETDCADNGIGTDGVLNCCRYQGGPCSASDACCGGLFCVGGVCSDSASTGGGLAPGAACTSTGQCSQAGGSVVCADNGIPADGALNCCRTSGGACTAANDSAGCCGGLICVNGACA